MSKQALFDELLKDDHIVFVDDKPRIRLLESYKAGREIDTTLEVISVKLYNAKFNEHLWCEMFIDKEIYDDGPYDVIAQSILRHLLDGMKYKENERSQTKGMDELIISRYYWIRYSEKGSWQLGRWSKHHKDFSLARCEWQEWMYPDPIRWVIIPSLKELLSIQIGDRDELIIGRYYWVQFYEDGSRQLGQWSKSESFDTVLFEQDSIGLDPMRWVIIPSVEELLSERTEV